MSTVETFFKITASVVGANAVSALRKEVEGVSTSGQKMQRALGAAALALRAFAASEAVQFVGRFVKSSIDLADSMNDISQRTGIAVETLARFKVAAENGGTSLDSLAGAVARLNRNMVDARGGTGAAADAFRAMGISIANTDGTLKKADEVILEISDRFREFPDGPQKAALAMAVFGRTGAELIPFLNSGSEEILKFSTAINQDFATAADAFNDRLNIMRSGAADVGRTFTAALLPALNDVMDSFSDVFSQTGAAETFGKIVGDVFRAIAAAALTVVNVFKQVANGLNLLTDVAGAAFAKIASFTNGTDVDFTSLVSDAQGRFATNRDANNALLLREIGDLAAGSNVLGDGGASQAQRARAARADRGVSQFSTTMNAFGGEAAADKAAKAYDKAARAADEFLAKQREELKTLEMQASTYRMTSLEVEKLKDAREFETQTAEKAANLSPKAAEAFRREAEAINQKRQALIDLNYEQQRTFETGAFQAFNTYAEAAMNAADQAKDAITNAMKGAEDALVEFTLTGKLNFRSFAQSILSDLARIAIQRSITGPIASALGGLFGGGGGFGQGITWNGPRVGAFASGGDFRGGLRLVGERGPELEATGPSRIFTAEQTRRMLTGGGGGTNVSVVVNMEGGNATRSDTQQGQSIGNLIASVVKTTLINEKRPGGLLAAT